MERGRGRDGERRLERRTEDGNRGEDGGAEVD